MSTNKNSGKNGESDFQGCPIIQFKRLIFNNKKYIMQRNMKVWPIKRRKAINNISLKKPRHWTN